MEIGGVKAYSFQDFFSLGLNGVAIEVVVFFLEFGKLFNQAIRIFRLKLLNYEFDLPFDIHDLLKSTHCHRKNRVFGLIGE
jgi:hypothetical protein